MVSRPPPGIASRAFSARLRTALSNWAGSATARPQAGGLDVADLDVLAERAPQERDQVRHRRGEVDGRRGERLLAREGEELAGQGRSSLGRPRRALDPLLQPGVAVELGPDELQVPEDDLQQVVEIVRDAAGQLPDRLHLLGLAQHGLGLGALGHVRDGQDEAAVRHRRPADLQVVPVRALALVRDRLTWIPAAVADLVLALQRGATGLAGVLGEGAVSDAGAEHGLRQVEQHLEALVPVREPAVGPEHRDALAEAVDGGAQAHGQRPLLGLGRVGARPRLVQEAGCPEHGEDRQRRSGDDHPAHPGRPTVVLREAFVEQTLLLGQHAVEHGLGFAHVVTAGIAVDDAQGVLKPAVAARLHGLGELLQLVLDGRCQGADALLLRGVVGGQLLQLALEQAEPVAGGVVGREVLVAAGEDVAALATLGVAQGDGEVLGGAEDPVAVLRPLPGLARGVEALPGHRADQGDDGHEDTEHEEVGAPDEVLGHGVRDCAGRPRPAFGRKRRATLASSSRRGHRLPAGP